MTQDSSWGADFTTGAAQTTGRTIVLFAQDAADPAETMYDIAGVGSVCNSQDFDGQALDMGQAADADATVFAELGMAVVSADASQVAALEGSDDRILAVVPELVVYALDDYVRGYRDGVADLAGRLGEGSAADSAGGAAEEEPTPEFADDDAATWGLYATGALDTTLSGAGIKVAVLDTGMDLDHPDFADRSITAESFIAGETPRDAHGHGTHCIGTSCGPKEPDGTRRYGVAYGADIFVGKVLSDSGSGSDAGVLAGINWAVAQECPVISMSLGADVPRPHPPYSLAGQRALERGSLIIAAAGNNANRPLNPGFVGSPANSAEIMAIGALDSSLQIARFSARSLPGRGGQVDLAAPGVAVYSAWPMPTRYRSISGTSMATPHVSGLAALHAEGTGARGMALWGVLSRESGRLSLPTVDVGAGLAQVSA